MLAYGSDRFRMAGERVILHSRLAKGWTPRRGKDRTHAEFPGTAVLWDEQTFEVVAADSLPDGGVRYVLEPWKDDHTIRVFAQYSAESETRLLADHRGARKQRWTSFGARVASIVLGNLPFAAQQRLANDLGLSPFSMTLFSTIPSVVLLGTCASLAVGATIDRTPSPVPLWLLLLAFFWFVESLLRLSIAMSQNRGVGSLAGTIVYLIFHPSEAVNDTRETFAPPRLDVPADVEMRDRVTMRGPLLTLLSVEEQRRLAELYAFDYRQHAPFLAWTILIGATLGIVSSVSVLVNAFRFSALVSLAVATVLAGEQIVRLRAFARGPAGSILAVFARPFARALLERS